MGEIENVELEVRRTCSLPGVHDMLIQFTNIYTYHAQFVQPMRPCIFVFALVPHMNAGGSRVGGGRVFD